MRPKDVKEIGEIQGRGRVKVVTLVDGTTYADGLKGNRIVFDQEESRAHAFCVNNNAGIGINEKNNQFKVVSFKYNDILSIATIHGDDGINDSIDNLLSHGTITNDQADKLRASMKADDLFEPVLDPEE